MRAHPRVKIQFDYLDQEEFKANLPTLLQSSDRPSVFHSWGGGVMLEQIQAGFCQDITGAIAGDFKDSFYPAGVEALMSQGRSYDDLYIGIGHCDGTFRWRTWEITARTSSSSLRTSWTTWNHCGQPRPFRRQHRSPLRAVCHATGERRNHAGDGPALRDPGGDFGSGVLVRQYLKLPRSTSLSPSTARGGERHARDQEGGSTPNNIMNLGKILRV